MRTGQWSVEHRLQHCLNFLPGPQGQGAFRSTFPTLVRELSRSGLMPESAESYVKAV